MVLRDVTCRRTTLAFKTVPVDPPPVDPPVDPVPEPEVPVIPEEEPEPPFVNQSFEREPLPAITTAAMRVIPSGTTISVSPARHVLHLQMVL